MAIGTGTAIAMGAGALLGGMAGGQKDVKSSEQSMSLNLAPESEQERLGRDISEEQLRSLRDMLQVGPGRGDVERGYQSQLSLADMLKNLSSTGGLPGQADIATGRQFASSAFQPQQLELQQAFKDQDIQAKRLAAYLGRNVNDPMVQARLRQENIRQSQMLGAQRNQYGMDIAMQLPGQKLNFAGQLANLQSGLASQALQNRQTLMALGSQVQQQGQNFRLQSAGRTVKSTEESGGGMKGAISGALSGASMGMGIAGAFGGTSGMTPQKVMSAQSGTVDEFGVPYTNFSSPKTAYRAPAAAPIQSSSGFGPMRSAYNTPGSLNLNYGY